MQMWGKKNEERRPRRWKMGAIVALLAVASTVLVPGSVSAQDDSPVLPRWMEGFDLPDHVEIVSVGANGRVMMTSPLGRVYGEAGDGYAIIAGGDLLSVCADEAPRDQEGVMYRRNGQYVTTTKPGGVQIPTYVYKTDGGVFDLFGEACEGWFENGTPIPTAFASGYLEVRATDWNPVTPGVFAEEQPVGRYRNSVRGVVADAEGNTFDVFAFAGYRVLADGGEPRFTRNEVSVTPTAG
jgi:hypothetical protein